MKERVFKNILSTGIGLIIIILSIIMYYQGKIETTALTSSIILGWTFISAKDSLVSGVTCGLYKDNEINK